MALIRQAKRLGIRGRSSGRTALTLVGTDEANPRRAKLAVTGVGAKVHSTINAGVRKFNKSDVMSAAYRTGVLTASGNLSKYYR